MSKVFIFDVDGTLTPSRQPMTKEFQEFFSEWVKKNKFYLVTGSDLPKLQEQMCMYDIEAEAIFTCCGNEMWKPDPHIVNISAYQIYENKFELTNKLKSMLDVILMASPYPDRYGNHIEDRGSMLNFSVVGRDCNQLQREIFYGWDNKHNERKKISNVIKEKFPELDAVLGGQISIDIYPKGNDKSQVLEHIKDRNVVSTKTDEFIFIGDRTEKGGNDYPLAKLMKETDNCSYYHTEGWKQTKKILKELND
jgi:phosphomannomutase